MNKHMKIRNDVKKSRNTFTVKKSLRKELMERFYGIVYDKGMLKK